MKLLAYDPFISTDRAEQLGCRLVDIDCYYRKQTHDALAKDARNHPPNQRRIAVKMKPTAD